MAHPLYHAKLSADRLGGRTEDYLPIHNFLDSTKEFWPDCRHRLLLHNGWGVFRVEEKFGVSFRRASDGKELPIRPIAERHVQEDLGMIPTLGEVLKPLQPVHRPESLDVIMPACRAAATRFGGNPGNYYPLMRLMHSPLHQVFTLEALRVTHNTWGVHLATELLGTEIALDGGKVATEEVARWQVMSLYHAIPTLADLFDRIPLEDWMCKRALPLSRIVEQRERAREHVDAEPTTADHCPPDGACEGLSHTMATRERA